MVADIPDAGAESSQNVESSPEGTNLDTEDDLAATVAAMRTLDEGGDAAEEDSSLAPEPAFTLFGCNVPTGGEEAAGAVSAGGDYLIAMAGLFGLIIARVRPGRNQKHQEERRRK